MSNKFKIGQHVKYMPPYRTVGELLEAAEHDGLEPRKLYVVSAINHDDLVFESGAKVHYTSFKNGELEYKQGKQDNTWQEQKQRLNERHENFHRKNT
ncbi:hypothetical protein O0V09_18845 [Dasania sp. GY-19]|uniref:Uncharacterized protein n=1 Tax=Dasania phycosphaerae TaxID=2950436 RepID=A0A9J6RS51_9GAMM|nr:hypothetical protein [Dasania phycosphaerae]MCZ0867260.1 hypothetical protein [Dasania phycosphaerae]